MGKILTTIMTTLLFAGSAGAVERTLMTEYDPGVREIQMLIQDVQESMRACDYHVVKMSYEKRRRVLSLTLAEEPCFTEVLGKKKALFKWNLPRSLHNNNFCLRVDNRNLGRLTFDGTNVAVTPGCN